MIIVFDTEATDLIPGQICQLSYLMIDHGGESAKNIYFSVDEMSEGAREVHGLGLSALDELSGGLRFEDRAKEIFEDFSAAKLLVGHNVSADDKYLRVEFERLGMRLPRINTFCTMNYFTSDANLPRKVNTGRKKPPKLCELAEHFDLSEDFIRERCASWFGEGGSAHDARYDTAATYLCLIEATRRGRIRGVL